MYQYDLFGNTIDDSNSKYTKKINTPIYEPNDNKPNVFELVDSSKSDSLKNEILSSNIKDKDKEFLIKASKRHLVFNYSKIADYYANSSIEVQRLMEKSALIIIDFEDSIKNGYVRLNDDLRNLYLAEKDE